MLPQVRFQRADSKDSDLMDFIHYFLSFQFKLDYTWVFYGIGKQQSKNIKP